MQFGGGNNYEEKMAAVICSMLLVTATLGECGNAQAGAGETIADPI